MQVAPSGGQNYNDCKRRHVVAKFPIIINYFMLPNVKKNIARGSTDPEIDSVTWIELGNNMAPLTLVAKFNPSYGVNFWVRCASGNVSCMINGLSWHDQQL